MATDEIKTVTVVRGTPGDRYVKCPHCGEQVNLPSGPVRGETFQHTTHDDCGGWFEVSSTARLLNAE